MDKNRIVWYNIYAIKKERLSSGKEKAICELRY